MEPSSAIVRRSLHDELVDRVGRLIVDGRLSPGQKVPEKELCARFGVSRTPLREALKVLAAEGLVTLSPNRGAAVSEVTEADLDEVFPVMGVLEALAGELAAARITEKELARIRNWHAAMLKHFAVRDLAGYFALNEKIHDAIFAAARNETLSAQYRQLAARVRRVRYVAKMSDRLWTKSVGEHEQMVAALEARDGRRLAAVLKRHLATKQRTVRVWLAKQSPSVPR